jgi:DNA-binding response OmpR family regulator
MNPPPTRIGIVTVSVVDRNDAYRQQLCQFLTRCPGVVVFDQCATLQEARNVLKLRMPRVLLLGDDLPDAPAWAALDAVRALSARVLTLALSDQRVSGHGRGLPDVAGGFPRAGPGDRRARTRLRPAG